MSGVADDRLASKHAALGGQVPVVRGGALTAAGICHVWGLPRLGGYWIGCVTAEYR